MWTKIVNFFGFETKAQYEARSKREWEDTMELHRLVRNSRERNSELVRNGKVKADAFQKGLASRKPSRPMNVDVDMDIDTGSSYSDNSGTSFGSYTPSSYTPSHSSHSHSCSSSHHSSYSSSSYDSGSSSSSDSGSSSCDSGGSY